jgi:hypothetical protein
MHIVYKHKRNEQADIYVVYTCLLKGSLRYLEILDLSSVPWLALKLARQT